MYYIVTVEMANWIRRRWSIYNADNSFSGVNIFCQSEGLYYNVLPEPLSKLLSQLSWQLSAEG